MFCLHVCLCFTCVPVHPQRIPALELQMFVNCPVGAEPGSPGRASSALHNGAIALALF